MKKSAAAILSLLVFVAAFAFAEASELKTLNDEVMSLIQKRQYDIDLFVREVETTEFEFETKKRNTNSLQRGRS